MTNFDQYYKTLEQQEIEMHNAQRALNDAMQQQLKEMSYAKEFRERSTKLVKEQKDHDDMDTLRGRVTQLECELAMMNQKYNEMQHMVEDLIRMAQQSAMRGEMDYARSKTYESSGVRYTTSGTYCYPGNGDWGP